MTNAPPIITVAHLLHRLDTGGMETVLVELINRLPVARYRHHLICLTDFSPAFARRITIPHVTFHALHKREGKDWPVWWRVWRTLRAIRPDVLHSCNLAALEGNLYAALAGVPRRIHVEHGRDSYDLTGSNPRYRLLRRLLNPFIHTWVAVSGELADWLSGPLHIPPRKVRLILNGIDTERFHPQDPPPLLPLPAGMDPHAPVLGCVGRLAPVKDHATLLRAFARLLTLAAQRGRPLPLLALLGDGPERQRLAQLARELGVAERLWLAGERPDVAALLGGMALFVLPSRAEGTPLTVLEAMACGLPVVATAVGGVPAVVAEGVTGLLVPAGDPQALAEALESLLEDPARRAAMGRAARQRVLAHHGMASMVAAYDALFSGGGDAPPPPPP